MEYYIYLEILYRQNKIAKLLFSMIFKKKKENKTKYKQINMFLTSVFILHEHHRIKKKESSNNFN